MTNEELRKELELHSEEGYRAFSAKLLPGLEHTILGVRLPLLRKLAKQLAKENWQAYLERAVNDSFEEIMLQGMVIGYAKASFEEKVPFIKTFVPKINCWSVCDSFCTGLKPKKQELKAVYEFLSPYVDSEEEYDQRFAYVMYLDHFKEDEYYVNLVLEQLKSYKGTGYYSRMAVAWMLSVFFVTFRETVLDFLKGNTLDDFTYNKTLQKIIESRYSDNETKQLMKHMKRK